jgi:hypothetical protein
MSCNFAPPEMSWISSDSSVGGSGGTSETLTATREILLKDDVGQNLVKFSKADNEVVIGLGSLTVPNVHITGSLQVDGPVVSDLKVEDSFVELGHSSLGTVADAGIMVKHNSGGVAKWSGLYREASTGQFALVKDLATAPIGSIDEKTVTLADLNVGALNSTSQSLVYGSDTVSTVIDLSTHKASMLHNGTAYMIVDSLNTVTIPKLAGTSGWRCNCRLDRNSWASRVFYHFVQRRIH